MNYTYLPEKTEIKNNIMFGKHSFDFQYHTDEIEIGIKKENGFFKYYRRIPGDDVFEKKILEENGMVIINPVEPVNLPKTVTKSNHLEIEFDPVIVGPNQKKEIFLKFPVEIGVFLISNKYSHLIDIFSFNSPKLSLYGNPNGGTITRWTKSEIYSSVPETDNQKEGVISIEIENKMSEWMEINRIILDGYGMKLYYDKSLVSMAGRMKIQSKKDAETLCCARPLNKGMKKSIEVFAARNIPVVGKTFTMEWGY
ncbi:DUF432 domain-containing protein [Methanoplanus sp. FWC-SCC4]|uniref:DUF432 domain-containing protein n=1 Tax=Methanochimaera problematica TaxID=2609417 RepID=A0AA97I439_9EURY|nr:DUF432 domain-containing protein [Methanoplanus sp. FWC-SCC4]WOF16109.1 DUF432 domain-containing protein [Methanoplanus sp. FWC-SCC4]